MLDMAEGVRDIFLDAQSITFEAVKNSSWGWMAKTTVRRSDADRKYRTTKRDPDKQRAQWKAWYYRDKARKLAGGTQR